MAVKKSGAVLESEAKIVFGTSESSYPSWDTPVTVSVVREFIPENDDWQQFIVVDKMRFTSAQWDKIEEFVRHGKILMENV